MVYYVCVLGTLLCNSEPWTVYSRQECCLNSSHLHCLRGIMGINPGKIKYPTYPTRFSHRGTHSKNHVFALLSKRRLRWFGHFRRIKDGFLSKNVLYDERTSVSRPVVRPTLSCKDVYNRDIKTSEIDPDSWESFECRMISALSLVLFGQVQRELRPGGNSCVTTKGTTKRGSCCPTLTNYSLHMWQRTGTDCHSRIGTFSNTIPYFKVRNLVFRHIPLSFETEGKNNQRRGTRMFKLSLKWLILYLYCKFRSLGWGPCWVKKCYRGSLCWKMALNWVITGQINWAAKITQHDIT